MLVSIPLHGTTLGPLIRSLQTCGVSMEAASMLDEAARAHLAQVALAEIRSATIEANGMQRLSAIAGAVRTSRVDGYKLGRTRGRSLAMPAPCPCVGADKAAQAELLGLHRNARVDDEVLRRMEAELDFEELGAGHALGTDEPG